jgi:hypothetical protein
VPCTLEKFQKAADELEVEQGSNCPAATGVKMIAQQLSQKQFVKSRASVHGVVSFKMTDCINERAHWLAALYVGDGSALCARGCTPRMRLFTYV